MVIDKISNIGKIFRNDKPSAPKARASVKGATDSVSISSEALKAQEASQVQSEVRKVSDVRAERVKEVKAKMARGDYDKIDNEILEKVADKIADALVGR